jgi:hypothetical protein
MAPRSARISGQAPRAIFRNSSVSCQYRSACGHVVHQAREIIGERECRCRIAGDERRLVFLVRRETRRPFEYELGEQHAALQPAKRSGQVERRRT